MRGASRRRAEAETGGKISLTGANYFLASDPGREYGLRTLAGCCGDTQSDRAEVAELADALGSGPSEANTSWGFKSPLRHHVPSRRSPGAWFFLFGPLTPSLWLTIPAISLSAGSCPLPAIPDQATRKTSLPDGAVPCPVVPAMACGVFGSGLWRGLSVRLRFLGRLIRQATRHGIGCSALAPFLLCIKVAAPGPDRAGELAFDSPEQGALSCTGTV